MDTPLALCLEDLGLDRGRGDIGSRQLRDETDEEYVQGIAESCRELQGVAGSCKRRRVAGDVR